MTHPMQNTFTRYAQIFAKLSRDRSNWSADLMGGAPHKPLLLLSIIDLLEQDQIKSNLIELKADLAEIFLLYSARVMPVGRKADISLPFFFLQSDKFWHLLPKPGFENIITSGNVIRGITRLKEAVYGASFDEELYQLLQYKEVRNKLRGILLDTYFSSGYRARLLEQAQVNIEAAKYSDELISETENEFVLEKKTIKPLDEHVKSVRDQAFRRVIVRIYDHHCVTCGIKVLTADWHTSVTAAHIVPWSETYNDDPRNGIALCSLCHWAFDEGLTTVNNHYKVKISPQLHLNDNEPIHLASFGGKEILRPNDNRFLPDLKAFEWHRNNVFRNA